MVFTGKFNNRASNAMNKCVGSSRNGRKRPSISGRCQCISRKWCVAQNTFSDCCWSCLACHHGDLTTGNETKKFDKIKRLLLEHAETVKDLGGERSNQKYQQWPRGTCRSGFYLSLSLCVHDSECFQI